MLVAALPWLVPWRALRDSRVLALAAPWLALAALSASAAWFVDAPGSALRTAGLQLGWAAALVLGATSELPRARWIAAAGAVSSLALWLAPGGLFGNPTYAATFIAPCLVWTVLSDLPWAPRLGASALMLAGIAASQSLAGAAAVAVGLEAVLVFRCPRYRLWIRIGLGAAILSGVALLPTLVPHVRGRLGMFQNAWSVALDSLPLGTGAGQLTGPYLQAQAAALARGTQAADAWNLLDHAHNEWLHALAEQGPLGFVLFSLPFAFLLRKGLPTPVWGALVAICASAMVSLPLYEPATALLAGIGLGQAARASALSAPKADSGSDAASGSGAGSGWRPQVAGYLRAVGAGCLLVVSLVASADLLADRLLVTASDRDDPAGLRRASALSLRPEPALRALADRLLPEHPSRARQAAEEAVRRIPTPGGWLLVGRAALAGLEPLDAVAAYREATRLHPRLIAGWVGLSYALHHAGDRTAARQAASRARSLRPHDGRLKLLPR